MSYPFIGAKWYSAGKLAEVRALVLHFAEGGNTVHYFQTTTKDVSSHFVLEYDGTIVQMVRDEDADHCQHISGGSWSYPGGLNRANGVAVLGKDVMDTSDPTRVNRYVHAIEIEGFRSKGMNAAQLASLVGWVNERRAKFPTIRGLLGHGDVQDKACPGALIPWDELGGHGLFPPPEEEPMNTFLIDPKAGAGLITVNGPGHSYMRLKDGSRSGAIDPTNPQWHNRPAFGPITLTPDIDGRNTTGERAKAYLIGTEAAAVLAADVTFTETNCADAVAAEHERTRAAAISAVEGI